MGNDANNANSTAAVSVHETTPALSSYTQPQGLVRLETTYDIIETLAPVRVALQNLLAVGIEQIALVTIRLHFDLDDSMQPANAAAQLASFRQAARSDSRHDLVVRSTIHLLDSLRVLVRKTDQVFLHNQAIHFVLRNSNQQGGEIVQTRLWEALLWRVHNMSASDLLRPRTMHIGHSGYQETQADIDACINAASAWQLHYEWHPEKPRKATRQSHAEVVPILDPLEEDLPVLARQLGIPYLSLLPRKLPVSLQQLVTPSLAQELRCFPVGRERDTLTVAMLDPRDLDALDRLRAETGLHIFPVLAHPQALRSALEQLV